MPFKEYQQNQNFLLPPNLQDFVPPQHLARVIDSVANQLKLDSLYARYSDIGCHAYHPLMMLKVLFYAYAVGDYSSRLIAYRLKSDLAFMFLSGLQTPDFHTVNRFRKDNLDLLDDLFQQIVRLCSRKGLVSLGTIALDGTRLKANASKRRTVEQQVKQLLEKVEAVDQQEDREQREESIYEIKRVNLTDPEANFMHVDGSLKPGYNGQVAVDSSHGVIVAAELSDKPADQDSVPKLVEQTKANTGRYPLELLADSGHSGYQNLEYLKEIGVVGYIPDRHQQAIERGNSSRYQKSFFVYEAEFDRYRCPAGEYLNYLQLNRHKSHRPYKVYEGRACGSCVNIEECSRGAKRTITRYLSEELQQEMRARLNSEEGKRKYAARQGLVESVFGDMKHNRKKREIWLRGKVKAKGEFLLMCIGHNLRKLGKYAGSFGEIFKIWQENFFWSLLDSAIAY